MPLALALALRLLLTADDDCYFVGNTRLLALPSCAIAPTLIDQLTEDPAPSSASSLQRRPGTTRGASPPVRPVVVVRGNEELERRLEVAQQQRIDAVAQRLEAESQLEVALEQRDAALLELAAARRELLELEGRLELAERRARSEKRVVEEPN